MECVGEEQVLVPERVALPAAGPWYGCGDGWAAHGAVLRERLGGTLRAVEPDRYPHALDLAALAAVEFAAGRTLAPEQAVPVYLRDRVV